MKFRYLLSALSLMAFGCTFTPDGSSNMNAAFTPPLVEHHWNVEHAVLQNGTKVCSISSGYNGVTVFLSNFHGTKDIAVKSNRLMQPGATLTVTAGGSSLEAYDTFFSKSTAPRVVENLAKGGKAYLEWSEFSGPSGRERVHVQNSVPLDTFATDLKECKESI